MLIKVDNTQLVTDREKTYLTTAVAAAGTTLTVASTDLAPAGTSSNVWSDNDYMIVGEIGSEKTEVMQMAAAVTSATSLTIDREGQAGGLRHAHPIGTPVYRIQFNQVEFSRNTTNTTTGVSALATVNLQPDDLFTRYEDSSNSTGFGFARFKNGTTNAFSSYSDGVNYEAAGQSSSRDPRTLFAMRKKVRQTLNELESTSKLTDSQIDEALNDRQRNLGHERLWSFFETELSASLVANQFAYDLPSTIQKVYGARVDTQPLTYMNYQEWAIRFWDTDENSTDPFAFSIWNNQLLIYPRPSGAAGTTTLGADLSASATSMTVAATSGFNRGDYYRVIIDSEVIYATAATSTTLTGLLRGRENTTAATHSNGATVTERDIVYSAHAEPVDLTESHQRTPVPEPDILVYGASADLAPFVGKEDNLEYYEGKYVAGVKSLENKYAQKQTGQPGRIKDMNERLIDNRAFGDSNRYPRSINT